MLLFGKEFSALWFLFHQRFTLIYEFVLNKKTRRLYGIICETDNKIVIKKNQPLILLLSHLVSFSTK